MSLQEHAWQSYLLKSSLDADFSKQVALYLMRFEERWIGLFEANNYSLCQLKGGSRLRPIIAFLGYLISSDKTENEISAQIIDLGISIELIHKASLLIDDIVDGDEYRNGVKTFHVVNGEDKALAMATYLIGLSFNILANSLKSFKSHNELTRYLEISSNILKDMSEGLMMELGMVASQKSRLENAKEIINKETASIIKNALTLGYLVHNPRNIVIERSLKVIGDSCGYIFQVMNDIEPFGDSESRAANKGNSIIEFFNNRKNLIVCYIHQMIDQKAKDELFAIKDKEEGTALLKKHFHQLEVWPSFKQEFNDLVVEINKNIDAIEQEGINPAWCQNCKTFVMALIQIAETRLHI